jgi:uncharacterized protein DUF1028
MTWSLIALDAKTGELGIAVATKFFAVGARVPFAAPNVARSQLKLSLTRITGSMVFSFFATVARRTRR